MLALGGIWSQILGSAVLQGTLRICMPAHPSSENLCVIEIEKLGVAEHGASVVAVGGAVVVIVDAFYKCCPHVAAVAAFEVKYQSESYPRLNIGRGAIKDVWLS